MLHIIWPTKLLLVEELTVHVTLKHGSDSFMLWNTFVYNIDRKPASCQWKNNQK